jgi:hypothetical protein
LFNRALTAVMVEEEEVVVVVRAGVRGEMAVVAREVRGVRRGGVLRGWRIEGLSQ